MRDGARTNPAGRREAAAALENDLLAVFAALADDERVVAVEQLTIRPEEGGPTHHAAIVDSGPRPASSPVSDMAAVFEQVPENFASMHGGAHLCSEVRPGVHVRRGGDRRRFGRRAGRETFRGDRSGAFLTPRPF